MATKSARIICIPKKIEPVYISDLRYEAQIIVELKDMEAEILQCIKDRIESIELLRRDLSRVRQIKARSEARVREMVDRLGFGADVID